MNKSEFLQRNGKVIAVVVIIAAIALIYIIKSANANGNDAATSDTPAATSTTTSDSTTDTATPGSTSTTTDTPATTPSTSPSTSTTYKDGTYSASGSYRTPQSTETINVSLTVAGDTVTAASVQQTPSDHESAEYQAAFKSGYQSQVVGKKLSDIKLSRVSGSSLTPLGFNTAVDQIKSQAKS